MQDLCILAPVRLTEHLGFGHVFFFSLSVLFGVSVESPGLQRGLETVSLWHGCYGSPGCADSSLPLCIAAFGASYPLPLFHSAQVSGVS